MQFNKAWEGLAVILFCGLTLLGTVGAVVFLACNGKEAPTILQSIAIAAMTGLLGLLKTTGSGDATISQEQMQSLSDHVVRAMHTTKDE